MVRRFVASEKGRWRFGLRKCIRPLGEPLLLALDGMRCAFVLLKNSVCDDVVRMTGFESAGFDCFAISLFASKPDGLKS
jgi:hypothetical protein